MGGVAGKKTGQGNSLLAVINEHYGWKQTRLLSLPNNLEQWRNIKKVEKLCERKYERKHKITV